MRSDGVITASSPGAIFFFGEHAVVYGYPALITAVDRRVVVSERKRGDDRVEVFSKKLGSLSGRVKIGKKPVIRILRGDPQKFAYLIKALELTFAEVGRSCGLNIEVSSDIPMGSGLSSSSAVSVATVAATARVLNEELSLSEVTELAFKTELEVQSIASRAGVAVATYGGFLWLRHNKIKRLNKIPQVKVVVGNTNVPCSTSSMVRKVRQLKEDHPSAVECIFRLIGTLTEVGIESIKKRDFERTGKLMDINQACLSALGVSSPELERLIGAARSAGALGAKLTGGGGGGCMVALVGDRSQSVVKAVRAAGGLPMLMVLGVQGLKTKN